MIRITKWRFFRYNKRTVPLLHLEGSIASSTKMDKISESCKFSLFFLLVSKLILIFVPAFRNECKDILLNSLSITTARNEQTSYIGTVPYGRSFPILGCGLWWAERRMVRVCVFSLDGISWNSRIKSEIMLNIYASRARFAMLRCYIKK